MSPLAPPRAPLSPLSPLPPLSSFHHNPSTFIGILLSRENRSSASRVGLIICPRLSPAQLADPEIRRDCLRLQGTYSTCRARHTSSNPVTSSRTRITVANSLRDKGCLHHTAVPNPVPNPIPNPSPNPNPNPNPPSTDPPLPRCSNVAPPRPRRRLSMGVVAPEGGSVDRRVGHTAPRLCALKPSGHRALEHDCLHLHPRRTPSPKAFGD